MRKEAELNPEFLASIVDVVDVDELQSSQAVIPRRSIVVKQAIGE